MQNCNICDDDLSRKKEILEENDVEESLNKSNGGEENHINLTVSNFFYFYIIKFKRSLYQVAPVESEAIQESSDNETDSATENVSDSIDNSNSSFEVITHLLLFFCPHINLTVAGGEYWRKWKVQSRK